MTVKRITYNGKKIKRLTHRQDDAATLSNAAIQTTGTVIYYTDFNRTIYCRPIPDSTFTLQVFSYKLPAQVTSGTQTLEIAAQFHMDMVDYLLAMMYAKDQNPEMAQYHMQMWAEHVKNAVRFKAREKRGDSFATVQDEETLPVTIFGEA